MKIFNRNILIIDNESYRNQNLQRTLKSFGYEVKIVKNGLEAIHYLAKNSMDVLISNLDTGEISKVDLVKESMNIDSSIRVIFIDDNSDIKNIVKVMRAGAHDYLEKSFEINDLISTIERKLEKRLFVEKPPKLNTLIPINKEYDGVVSRSEKMKVILSMIDRIAQSNATVLLMGESGVGKEVLAKMIHKKSTRRDKRFVVINCAAIPEKLIESELFGHEKGSFTGASSRKIGKFEQAEGGTIFLDEMAELSLNMQVKFLRVLQERELERIGSSNSIDVDVRIIAATNKDLLKELQNGNFREDLYYRVNVVKIEIPPLRERREDISMMVNNFLFEFSKEYEKNLKSIDIEAMHILLGNEWKGNVRELKNVIERSVVIAKKNEEVLTIVHLPTEILRNKSIIGGKGRTEMTLKEYEKLIIIDTLNRVDGNKTKAAEILDIKRQTIYNKIKEYNL
jgi:DNA-binding NtrC family response regulator